ncbi:copper radical oxidase [Hyaloscypha bicolor E]|uniref:Copper radical oxidase n=1 Tax=Hyaloscypha bicolor E TaxID=1095630 RepID=A0A2J6SMA8_9HELO|nr:copper radical oxidase [Hyaloscypha bicolor E]PMD51904.1 copper radical oxidase [Hyaloscypha bicolor E]
MPRMAGRLDGISTVMNRCEHGAAGFGLGRDPNYKAVLYSGDVPPEDIVDFQECRVEVFTPPYLLSGLPRPTFKLANTDRAYGQFFAFALISDSTANLKVSLLGALTSTHGNSMAQRTIFPNVPTPSINVFVRISSDPACLSNQSQGLRFGLPGV